MGTVGCFEIGKQLHRKTGTQFVKAICHRLCFILFWLEYIENKGNIKENLHIMVSSLTYIAEKDIIM